MSIKESIYFRSKHFVEKEKLKRTIKGNGLNFDKLDGVSLELLETMESVKNYKKESTVLLDIGTHVGSFAKTADAFFKFPKIVCFEPNSAMNESIRNNNKSSKNLVIENIALSNEDGQVTFYMHQDSTMNSIVEAEEGVLKSEFPWDDPSLMKETTVPTTTLDNYILKNGLQSETFVLKIDTQGNELNVLQHGIRTLERTEICLVEYMFTSPYKTNYSFIDLVLFMEKNNFECKGALTISKRPSKRVSAVDFLFVKKEKI